MRLFKKYSFLLCFLSFANILFAQVEGLVVTKVWEAAPHNAFPDIRFYKGSFYLVFRESNMHVHAKPEDDGKIRVLTSADAQNWQPFQLIEKKGFDLRDPMLEITSDNRLMLLMGGSIYEGKNLRGAVNHVSFLEKEFTNPQPVSYSQNLQSTHNWLWSITWHKGTGYGIIYQFEPGKKNKLMLVSTKNGIDYSLKTDLSVEGKTSESKAMFISNKQMLMVVRRDGNPNMGAFGISKKPFTKWDFKNMNIQLGGPHLIRFSKEYWILSTRSFKANKSVCTSLFALNKKGETIKLIDLPECGNWDCSYPGMEIHKDKLFVSYYSSHEGGKTKIYLASVPLKAVKERIKKESGN
jgi:hypothetical protein